jgi:NodT family efflux transporter outer membrane factor (OMF) lipoprotein
MRTAVNRRAAAARGGATRAFLVTPFIAMLLPVAGCTVGPNYRPPKVEVPAQWLLPPEGAAATTQPSLTTTQRPNLAAWWATFDDPTLDALVRRAIEGNLDLRQATSRIRAARAARRVTSSGFWPTVDTSGSYRRSGSGARGRNGGVDLFQAGLDAAWELDVFGGIRRGIEAAEADVRSTVEDRRDVLVTLVSEVALDYMDLRGLQRQIAIARENLVTQQRSTDIARRQFNAGLVSGLDLANATAQVATTESQIPLLESDTRQVIYAISVLLGREPGALLEELSAEAPIPATPAEVPVGLPSDLLLRRPDVRRAEADLHAATARVGVATADLFPRFSLTGSFGVQSDQFKGLFDLHNRAWSVGPSVRWPLFDAGRIRANVEISSALQEQALLSYRATVLVALQDVENALVAYASEQRHREALSAAVAANRRAVDLATQLYTRGQTDFLNVLTAQRSLFSSEEALAQSDVSMATNLIALYKALGGGWELPAAPATRPRQ